MNFSPIISWARSTSYDVVGILIPGTIAILLGIAFTTKLPGISTTLDISGANGAIGAPSKLTLGIQENALFFVLLAYLIGFSIKTVGDSVTSRDFLKNIYYRKYYFFGRIRARPDYSDAGEALLPTAAKAINRYLSTNSESVEYISLDESMWPKFYRFSQSILEINQYPTKAVTYQNRYELFKSLSIVFLLFVGVALLNVAATFILAISSRSLESLNDFLTASIVLAALIFFSLQSRDLFLKHWRNLGDTLITSIIVVLRQIATDKPKSADSA